MPASRQKQLEMLQRREKVADLYLKGWTQAAIAIECGCAQSRISVDLARIREAWLKSAIRNFDVLRERELQRIDRVEREAWAAWERSQQPVQSAVVTGEDITKRTKKSVQQKYGDPRFLDIVHKCIAQRRAMLGLDLVVVPAPEPEKLTPMEQRQRDVEETQQRLRRIARNLGIEDKLQNAPQPSANIIEQAVEGNDEHDQPPPPPRVEGWNPWQR